MRAFCTVSAPLEVCASSAEQLSPGSRFLALRLLGNQQPKTLYFLVDAKSRVREVYTQTCLHFATQGMLDTELFGLAVLIDGEYMFADPESKLSKYGPKSWRSSHTHGLDANGRPLLELHFRVQFYIESPFLLKDETSRHNYYLQLKYNALHRDIPKEYSEQSMILLAALALQADLGDAPTTPPLPISPPPPTAAAAAKSAAARVSGVPEIESSGDKAECGDSDGTANVAKLNATNLCATAVSAAEAATTTTSTTTLPKISKRTSSANERLEPSLSTYNNSASEATKATTTPTTPTRAASSSSSSSSVFQISASLKRAVVASLSASSSSISSLSHGNSAAAAAQSADYFRLEDYLPAGLRNTWAASALRACHRENRGMCAADAKLHYIQQACLVHESINAHTFRMRMVKSEHGPGNSWFVVYAKGIKIFGVGDTLQQQITFLWPNITKLSFERKKFEIRSGDSKITLYATSDEKNKMLLTLCKETHQFSMKIAARLKEVIKREEEEESNCLHACYNYSRSLHLPAYKNKSDQRISVISSTSSNTTSGIVSDRVHSEDELEIMINTPPAPIPAPSTESLALAHLLDHPSISRQTSSVGQVSLKDLEEQLAALSVHQAQKQRSSNSSGGESPTEFSHASVGNSSNSDSNLTSSQRNADSSTATDSPSSQHNVGSQCSSTCSTVVVASASESASNALTSLTPHPSINSSGCTQRRNSTSSSLELGFSHTAQNSTLSEQESTGIEHDYVPSTRDDTESVSGVYTLAHGAPPTETSGVYTMHSSELTGQSSEIAESEKSSHYGIFQPAKSEISDDHLHKTRSNLVDSVDGGNYHGKRIKSEDFRLRSDSNVSTSGSFRGDGSDPTDNKHSLLSAEELTDLIVGRGTYPNRKTVSSTLDSDCDYVTLPLPMEGESYIQGHQDTAPTEDHVEDLLNDLLPTDPPAPPQRIDSNSCNHTNLASLRDIRMHSPPPYEARHEKTGLCGPPVRSSLPTKISTEPAATTASAATAPSKVTSSAVPPETKPVAKASAPLPPPPTAAIRRRDPPPYPTSAKPRPTSLVSVSAASAVSYNNSSNALSNMGGSMTSLKSEEVTARFITTRPQISILKAHTSLVNESPKPSYAAPTHCSSAASSAGSIASHHIPSHMTSHLSQHSVHNSNYASGSQSSLSLSRQHQHQHYAAPPHTNSARSAAAAAHVAAAAAAGAGVIPTTIGIPIVPYSLHSTHKSMSSLHQHPPPPPPPYTDMKPQTRTCVLLPVIKPRQFLPPPPPSLPRQPPPPPPPQLHSMYTSQLARKQLELYQQQLYSDVDYVIYPIQDPAVSQQEYLDAKQGSILAAMAQTPPPPHPYLAYHTASAHAGAWDTCKGHAIYRSTPYLPLALSAHSRYASTQNLSDTYVQLPSAYSPLYSPSMASLCSSYEPPPPPLHPAALAGVATNAPSLFARSRSDDNILNSFDSLPKMKRLPPPPPPPYVNRRLKKPPMPAPTERPPPIPSKPAPSLSSAATASSCGHQPPMRYQLPPRTPPTLISARNGHAHMTKTSSGAQWAGERPRPDANLNRGTSSILAHLQASVAAANRQSAANQKAAGITASSAASTSPNANAAAAAAANALDIALLREKSRHHDLPLISALCNDRSLLKQTKVLVNPKHTRNATSTTHCDSGSVTASAGMSSAAGTAVPNTGTTATTASSMSTSSGSGNHVASKSLASALTAAPAASVNGEAAAAAPASPTAAVAAASGKYTASSQSTAPVSKPRKTSISHRHPNDKLPPLPMQLAEANNYVMDPAMQKHHHKSYNSQT